LLPFIFLAAGAANIDACATAVHGNVRDAVIACDTSTTKVDLFGSGGTPEACIAAMKAGRDVGKYGPSMPAPARAGLIKEFDKKLSACQAPEKKSATPTLETTQLWD